MAEPSRPRHRQPLARTRTGFLDTLIRGHPGADDRGRFDRRQAGRDVRDVVRVGENILGETAVLRIAAELRRVADGFPAAQAMLAAAACRVEPGNADSVADGHSGDPVTERDDAPDPLVAGNERRHRLDWPVAARRVQIGVADPAGLGLDQNLPRSGHGNLALAKLQRTVERFDNGSVHRIHGDAPAQANKACSPSSATAGGTGS